jgi:hypothetical protein
MTNAGRACPTVGRGQGRFGFFEIVPRPARARLHDHGPQARRNARPARTSASATPARRRASRGKYTRPRRASAGHVAQDVHPLHRPAQGHGERRGGGPPSIQKSASRPTPRNSPRRRNRRPPLRRRGVTRGLGQIPFHTADQIGRCSLLMPNRSMAARKFGPTGRRAPGGGRFPWSRGPRASPRGSRGPRRDGFGRRRSRRPRRPPPGRRRRRPPGRVDGPRVKSQKAGAKLLLVKSAGPGVTRGLPISQRPPSRSQSHLESAGRTGPHVVIPLLDFFQDLHSAQPHEPEFLAKAGGASLKRGRP